MQQHPLAIDDGARDRSARLLFGHPAGLTVLFLSAMWEIFALFGMRAVLIYYLIKQLRFSPSDAVEIYGLSTAAAFLTALLGGALADRYLGPYRATIAGALLMAAGQFLLAFEPLLYPGLAIIALGNGLYKPTMLGQVGSLYAADDPRRDRGYNIYSVGCNLGATISPLVCGAIGELYGWNRAFIASGVGMVLSALIYFAGRSFLPQRRARAPRAAGEVTPASSVFRREALIVLAVAWIGGVFFWTAYGQIGGTVALWAESGVDRTLQLGARSFSIPAAWFQSINPLLIFVLAPCVNWLWARDRSPVGAARDLRKMALGAAHLAACFVILASVASVAGSGLASPVWLLLALVPFTLGELYLNTIGQALFSRAAPYGYVSLFMGIWILTLMLGHAVSGWLGRLWTALSTEAFFSVCAAVALVGCAILACARPLLVGRSAAAQPVAGRL